MDGLPVILIGFMGSGKSAVGRILAEKLHAPFADLDHIIERAAGRSIASIFAEEGESGFRDREHRALLQALREPFHILSCGGGAILRDENRALLLQQPRVFCLNATPETLWQRVRHDRSRPLLQTDDPRAALQRLYDARLPIYQTFPRQISTDGFRTSEVADHILSELRKTS